MEVVFKGLSPISSNGYIVYSDKTRDGFIIDPGEKGKSFIEDVKALNLNIKGIILTHHHGDHCGGVKVIINELNCDVYISEIDKEHSNVNITKTLKDGDEIFVGEDKLVVINTPGHTEGSIVLYCETDKKIFTGDTLFDVEIGRTDLFDGSPEKMKNTMQNIVNMWSDDMEIFPGHGAPTNMANERKYNTEFIYALSL